MALSDKWRFVYESDTSSPAPKIVGKWIRVAGEETGSATIVRLLSTKDSGIGGEVAAEEAAHADVMMLENGINRIGDGINGDALPTTNDATSTTENVRKPRELVVVVNGSSGQSVVATDEARVGSFFGANRRNSSRRSRESSREKSPTIVITPGTPTTSGGDPSRIGNSNEFVRGGSGRFSLRGARSIIRRGVDSLMGRRPSSGGNLTPASSTSSSQKLRSGSGGVRPVIGDPMAPTSAEFSEKMQRLGCVDVRTLAAADDAVADDAAAIQRGRVSSGVSIGSVGTGSLPRAMSSDSLVGVLQRLALVTDCSMAVPIAMELQPSPSAVDPASATDRSNVDAIVASRTLHQQNGTANDPLIDHRHSIAVASDISRHRGGGGGGSSGIAGCAGRTLPDVVIDARVAAATDVAVDELAIWSRYFDVCFCDCRLPPEIGSCRNGSWSSTAPWWWSWSSSQSQAPGPVPGDDIGGGGGGACSTFDSIPVGDGQSELDRILTELDQDIILLDQTLNGAASTTGIITLITCRMVFSLGVKP